MLRWYVSYRRTVVGLTARPIRGCGYKRLRGTRIPRSTNTNMYYGCLADIAVKTT